MKAKPYQIEALKSQITGHFKAALIYGTDGGVVQETSEKIAHFIAPNLSDTLSVIKLTPSKLKEQKSILMDEGDNLSFLGERKLLWIKEADLSITEAVSYFVEHSHSDSFLLLSAAMLNKNHELRLFCEAHPLVLTIACYEDTWRDVQANLRTQLTEAGYQIDTQALDMLTERLNGDRIVSRMEIQKLLTFKGDNKQITQQDINNIVTDTSSTSLEELCYAVANGQEKKADKALHQLLLNGENPVSLLHALQYHFTLLLEGNGLLEKKMPLESALKKLLRPAQFRLEHDLAHQLTIWKKEPLVRVLNFLIKIDRDFRKNLVSPDLLLQRAVSQIAQIPRKIQRR